VGVGATNVETIDEEPKKEQTAGDDNPFAPAADATPSSSG
jgi:hypothetical protein